MFLKLLPAFSSKKRGRVEQVEKTARRCSHLPGYGMMTIACLDPVTKKGPGLGALQFAAPSLQVRKPAKGMQLLVPSL